MGNKLDMKKPLLLAFLLSSLLITSPSWLPASQHKVSNYEAPWVYPAAMPAQH